MIFPSPTSRTMNRRPRRVVGHADTVRRSFRHWLRKHRRDALRMPLVELITRYGHDISVATAYRVAISEGLRGLRRNMTRYSEFWDTINWALPDRVLTRIWGVSRQNLRQRRLRTRVGSAKHASSGSLCEPAFRRAVAQESQKASRYAGLRPH